MGRSTDEGRSAYQEGENRTTLAHMAPGRTELLRWRKAGEIERMTEDIMGARKKGHWLCGLEMDSSGGRTTVYGAMGAMTTEDEEMQDALRTLKAGDGAPIAKSAAEAVARAGLWVEKPTQDIDETRAQRWATVGVSPARGAECAGAIDSIEWVCNIEDEASTHEAVAGLSKALQTFGLGGGPADEKSLKILWTRTLEGKQALEVKSPWVAVMPVWQGTVVVCAGAIGQADATRPCPQCVGRALEWGPWASRTQWGDDFEARQHKSVARAMRDIEEESRRIATHIARCLAGHESAAVLKWWPCDEARARPNERIEIDKRCPKCTTPRTEQEGRWWEEDRPEDAYAYLEAESRRRGSWTGHFSHLGEAQGIGVNDGRSTFSWFTSRTARTGALAIVAKLPGYRQHSGGKGASPGGARHGAIAEAIERTALVWRSAIPYTSASASELKAKGANIITPDELARFSERQWAERETINERGYTYLEIPLRFEKSDAERAIAWIEYADVETGTPRATLVPRTFTYFGCATDIENQGRAQSRRRTNYCIADSNGVAAAANRSQACARGFCELVERHGFALWWYNQIVRPALDPEKFEDPTIRGAPGRMRRIGRRLELLDASVTRTLPTIIAVSWREPRLPGGESDPVFSAGCGPTVEIAARRAITEHAQLSPSIRRQWSSCYRQHRGPEFAQLKWWTGESEPWLAGDRSQEGLGPEDYPHAERMNSRKFLEHTKRTARALGTRFLAHDLLPHEREFAAVRVLAPELCHFWHRLGDPRLREEPVALGWTRATKTEEALNSVPVIL